MERTRYILAGLIGLGLIVLVSVLIFRGFTGGNANQNVPKAINLNSYASTDAVAQLVIDTAIVSEQDHRTVKISVSQNQTQIQILQGYQGEIINSQTFSNNQASYAVFLRSLALQNFTKGDADPKKADERGYCPQGRRYIYRLDQYGVPIMRFWSTSCSQGTFSGNREMVRWLFEHQIPKEDYARITSGLI